jgi:hypothetical protein
MIIRTKEYDQLDAERQSSKMPLDVLQSSYLTNKLCMLIADWV